MNLTTISEAAQQTAKWRAGFGYEFLERADGFKGLAELYGLSFLEPPREMDLGLMYRALSEGRVDLIAGNSTEGLVDHLDLVILEDDREYFPPYQAAPVVNRKSLERHQGLREVLARLGDTISDEEMRTLNYAVDGQHRDLKEVVGSFLAAKGLSAP